MSRGAHTCHAELHVPVPPAPLGRPQTASNTSHVAGPRPLPPLPACMLCPPVALAAPKPCCPSLRPNILTSFLQPCFTRPIPFQPPSRHMPSQRIVADLLQPRQAQAPSLPSAHCTRAASQAHALWLLLPLRSTPCFLPSPSSDWCTCSSHRASGMQADLTHRAARTPCLLMFARAVLWGLQLALLTKGHTCWSH